MRAAALLAALFVAPALAGCNFGGLGSAGSHPALASFRPLASAGELQGTYDVAGIDGVDYTSLDRQFAVSISGDRIDVSQNCVGAGWSYRFDGTQLVTQALDGPTCRRAMTDEEQALGRAFTGAQKVSRTPWDGLVVEGTGGTVTLFSH